MAKAPIEKEDYSTRVAREFCEAIAAGTAPWMKPWAAGELQAAYNPTTGKPYRGFNQTYLSFQPHGDPRWMTYKQAEAAGAQVRKGESGTTIEYWQWSEERSVKDGQGKVVKDGQGNPLKQSVELASPKRFYARVFNAEQIDGLPALPPPEVKSEWERQAMAEAVISNSPAALRHLRGDRAYYQPAIDRITLPERDQFPSADLYYATAFHEIAHSTGHPSRLDRDMAHPFGTPDYAREELVAEIASFMMSQRTGLPFDPAQHQSYVGGWIKALEKDPREIFRAAAAAEKAMDFVLGLELAQRVEITEPILSAHIYAAALQDDRALEQAIALEQQLQQALKVDGGNDRDAGRLNDVAISQGRAAAASFALAQFAEDSPEQAKVAALIVRGAIPDPMMRGPIVGTALGIAAGTQDLADWRDDLTAQIVAAGQNGPVWERVDSRAWVAIGMADRAIYLTDLALVVGENGQIGVEAASLGDQLGAALDEMRFDGHMEFQEAVAAAPEILAVRERLEAFARESEARAFLAGVLIYDHLSETVLGGELSSSPIMAPAEVEQRLNEAHRELRAHGLGLTATNQSVGKWLPDNLTVKDFRDETAALGLSEREQTAALIFGRDIANALNGGIPNSLPGAPELTTPFEDLMAFAQRGEAQMMAATHVLDMAMASHPEKVALLRPSWALAAALVEDRVNDIRLNLHDAEMREAALEELEHRDRTNDRAERAADLAGDATIDPDHAQYILDKEFPMFGEAEAPTRTATERVYLTTKFGEHTAAKAAGAEWDKTAKAWYAAPGVDLTPLSQWLPENKVVETLLTPQEEFMKACEAHGLIMDGLPKMDGEFYRVPVSGDQKNGVGKYIEQSGTYRAFDEKADPLGHPAGYIQNFRSGRKVNWKYSGVAPRISDADRARQEREQAERKAAREAQTLAGHTHIAGLVTQLLDQAAPVPADHAYLEKKDIGVGGLTMMEGAVDFPPDSENPQRFGGKNHLLVPAHDIDGKVWTAQAISPTGKKSFARDGRKSGCHNAIGDLDNQRPILFAEGYATGRDLHEQTTYPVVVCFDSGNLGVVMAAYRERYPDRLLVAAGDNDHAKPLQLDDHGKPKVNVGLEKAIEAAKAVGGYALLPQFKPENDKASDWNDLRQTEGKDEQLKQLREGMGIAIRQHKAGELTRTGEGERLREVERVKEQKRGREDEREVKRSKDRGPSLEERRELATSLAR